MRNLKCGVRFRRQHPIGDYIADFICIEKNLIIEVDGKYHDQEEQRIDDNTRTDFLNKHGFYVLRFTNDMVMTDMDYVLDRIKELLNNKIS